MHIQQNVFSELSGFFHSTSAQFRTLFMNDFTKKNSAETHLAEDSVSFPSHPAFPIAERAYRRGFVHALNEIAYYAENVPAEFRAWIKANLAIYEQWRSAFKSDEDGNAPIAPPPILPYHKETINETEYAQPCPDCMGYGHPVKRQQGWRVLCTQCSRRTPYFGKKAQALKAWNKPKA